MPFLQTRTDPSAAEVKRMRVHPDHQGRGHGAAMLQRLEATASELGVRLLSLDTGVGQTAAQRLYERSGYRQVGRATLGAFDQLLYEKELSGGSGTAAPQTPLTWA